MYIGYTANKVFESIDDVALSDILGLDTYLHIRLWNEDYEGDLPYYLHISELSFEEFAKHMDKPIKQKPNTRYYMIIVPTHPLEYFQEKDKSIDMEYLSFTLNEKGNLTSGGYFNVETLRQNGNIIDTFKRNLEAALADYLGYNQEEFMIINMNDISNKKSNKNQNVSYYDVSVNVDEGGWRKVKFIEDSDSVHGITILDVE